MRWTVFPLKNFISQGHLAYSKDDNFSREKAFLMRFFFTIGFLIAQISILKRIWGGFLIKLSSSENA